MLKLCHSLLVFFSPARQLFAIGLIGFVVATSAIAFNANADVLTKREAVGELLNRESIGRVLVDEFQDSMLFELIGAAESNRGALPYLDPTAFARARSKIFVANSTGAGAELLFEQDAQIGYSLIGRNPVSPDQRYIGYTSLRDGRYNFGVFDRHLDRSTVFDHQLRYYSTEAPVYWVSDEWVLFQSMPIQEGEPRYLSEALFVEQRAREAGWRRGKVTANAVGGGVYGFETPTLPTTLVQLLNVRTGEEKVLSKGPFLGLMYPSPDGAHVVATMIVERHNEQHGETVSSPAFSRFVPTILEIATGRREQLSIERNSRASFHGWSQHGSYFLLKLTSNSGDSSTTEFRVIDARTGEEVDRLPEGVSEAVWIQRKLLFRMANEEGAREDWWVKELHDSNKSALTLGLEAPPTSFSAANGSLVFAVLGGELWGIDIDTLDASIYSEDVNAEIGRANRHDVQPFQMPRIERVSFPALNDDGAGFVSFDRKGSLVGGGLTQCTDCLPLAVTKSGFVFLHNNPQCGSKLSHYGSVEGSEAITIRRFNEHLSRLHVQREVVSLVHKDYAGRTVNGWMYLPAGASSASDSGHPLIVIPYAGSVYDSDPPTGSGFAKSLWDLELWANTSMEVFLTRGYAVLLPSVPLSSGSLPGNPLKEIPPAIESAVDAAIGTGTIDPDRIAISGHSLGGFTALAMATRSKGFKAIIAMSPISNLTSMYGQYKTEQRYSAGYSGLPGSPTSWILESRWGRMGSPPWEDETRYVENSPLFFADHVEVPIMIVHGEFDSAVPIAQSEEFVTALTRQNKDVVFVRYWGEQHIVLQPQNQHDMWRRIFSFLEDSGVTPGSSAVH